MESNDSPEIPDRGETSDIPGLPSGEERGKGRDILQLVKRYIKKKKIILKRVGHLAGSPHGDRQALLHPPI